MYLKVYQRHMYLLQMNFFIYFSGLISGSWYWFVTQGLQCTPGQNLNPLQKLYIFPLYYFLKCEQYMDQNYFLQVQEIKNQQASKGDSIFLLETHWNGVKRVKIVLMQIFFVMTWSLIILLFFTCNKNILKNLGITTKYAIRNRRYNKNQPLYFLAFYFFQVDTI